MASPSLLGLPLLDAGVSQVNLGCGYWNFGTMNGYGGGIWSVNLYANGFPGIADYTQLHVLRRAGTGSPWTISGIHIPAAGSIISPIGNRSAMNTWGHYGISSGSINPLPIELISFEAISKENEVLLQWRTATETNNDYFSIERSSDGISFSEIKNIPGAGNSTIERSYQTFDNNPLSGVSYYRLKQTDFDGKFTYSEIQTVHSKIKENLNELVIKQISPNPFDSFFNAVFITNSNEEVFVELLNYSGSVIHSEKIAVEKGENTFHFDDDNSLIPGIYFCRISNGNKTATQKLLKG